MERRFGIPAKNREHVIEIDELVLTGSPRPAEIEAAVLRSLREARTGAALAESRADVGQVAREVTRAATGSVKRGKV
jgi:hypothetical protein